jgi:drug/metabolite transporter (DMT)-like permease
MSTDSDRSRALGILLIVASTVFFALAGIFTSLATSDPMTIAGWRGLVGAVLITLYVVWRARRDGAAPVFRLGWRGWMLSLVGAVSSVFFIASFKFTYVANVAVIYATVPFTAAAIEWPILGEKPRARTMATALASLLGVGIIMSGGMAGGNLFGDLLALLMTIGCAIYLVMIRAFRDTPVVWAAAVSALMVFATSFVVAEPLAVAPADLAVIGAFGFSFAAAVILWTEGAMRLPAAEAGLLGAAEVPLAVAFAWMILGQVTPAASLLGGAVVLAAVLFHAGSDLAAMTRRRVPAS